MHYQVSRIESISKHELLPDHQAHLVTQGVEPFCLVQPSTPGYPESSTTHYTYSNTHVPHNWHNHSPDADHVLIAVHCTLQQSCAETGVDTSHKGIHWNDVGAFGIDGNITVGHGAHHKVESESILSHWILSQTHTHTEWLHVSHTRAGKLYISTVLCAVNM